jgi:hypothetical protein
MLLNPTLTADEAQANARMISAQENRRIEFASAAMQAWTCEYGGANLSGKAGRFKATTSNLSTACSGWQSSRRRFAARWAEIAARDPKTVPAQIRKPATRLEYPKAEKQTN